MKLPKMISQNVTQERNEIINKIKLEIKHETH